MEFKLESMPIIKKVTAISTIQSVLNTQPFSKASLAETHKLLILLSTYEMSSATAERTFSIMRLVSVSSDAYKSMFAAIHLDNHFKLPLVNCKVNTKCFMHGKIMRLNIYL